MDRGRRSVWHGEASRYRVHSRWDDSSQCASLPRRDDNWAYIEPIRENWPKNIRLIVSGQQTLLATDVSSESAEFQAVDVLMPSLELGTEVLFYANETLLTVAPGLVCRVPQDHLAPLFCTSDDRMVPIELDSDSDKISFGIMKLQEAIRGHIELESAWLQTVINQSQRRDRCVMRIESNKDTIQIELPTGWRRNEIKVYLNGKPAVVQPTESEQSIWVKLSEATGISKRNSVVSMGLKRSDLLEFFSWTDSQSSWFKKVEPVLPSIEGVTSPFPFDWQVVTSADECLWSRSYSLLPERRWNWSNLSWSSSLVNAQSISRINFRRVPSLPCRNTQMAIFSKRYGMPADLMIDGPRKLHLSRALFCGSRWPFAPCCLHRYGHELVCFSIHGSCWSWPLLWGSCQCGRPIWSLFYCRVP